METNINRKIPDLVSEVIHKIDEDAEVILFGSRARNDYKEESDWDFLIILSKEVTREIRDLIRDELYEIELSIDQVISSIIYEKEDWENLAITPLYQIIQEEGIEIWVIQKKSYNPTAYRNQKRYLKIQKY